MESFYIVSSDNKSWLYIGDGSVVLAENHSFTNDIVSFPLEDGSPLVDHVIVNANELEVSLFSSNSRRQTSRDTFESLKRIRDSRALVSVYTYHTIYRGMVVKSVSLSHAAPFTGALNITVSFQQIDFINSQNEENPRSIFEEVDPYLFSLDPYDPSSAVDLSAFDPIMQPGQNILRDKIEAEIARIEGGEFPPIDDIVESASDVPDLGDGESYQMDPDFDFGTMSTTSIDPAAVSNAATSKDFSAIAAFENIAQRISNAYSEAGNLTQEVSNKLRQVQQGISFITNLSVGAQRFTRTIKGQVLGVYNYFDTLTGCWSFAFSDGQGADLIAGAAIVVGANALNGMNIKYPSVQSDGTTKMVPLAINSFYMSPPVTGSASVTAKGAESSPVAFAAGKDGIAPCAMFFFTDSAAQKAYEDLIMGLELKSPNVKLNDMDYVIG